MAGNNQLNRSTRSCCPIHKRTVKASPQPASDAPPPHLTARMGMAI
jgi:hypothetical protein